MLANKVFSHITIILHSKSFASHTLRRMLPLRLLSGLLSASMTKIGTPLSTTPILYVLFLNIFISLKICYLLLDFLCVFKLLAIAFLLAYLIKYVHVKPFDFIIANFFFIYFSIILSKLLMTCNYKDVLTAMGNNIYIVPKFLSKRA